MNKRNFLQQLGLGSLWLVLSAIIITALASFVDATHGSHTTFLNGENERAAKLHALKSAEQQISTVKTSGHLPITNYAGWEGDFHYKLEHKDGFYHGSAEFLKMKGLRGETVEDVEIKGHIVFTPVRGRILYEGEGAVTYSIARMNLSALGDGMVVHFLEGNGNSEIRRFREGTFLRMNRAAGKYSFRIEPGKYEADIDAFGVKVLAATEMKVTQAFIEKMESEDRPVLYPEALKEMFPEYDWYPDRDHIVLEAFDMPLPGSGNTLSGSFIDEKGGVLSWKFVGF